MTELIRLVLFFIVFILGQSFIANTGAFTLLGLAVPKLFLVYLLMFPVNTSLTAMLFIAFFMGISIDILNFPIGAHAFSSVLFVTLRTPWINFITPKIIANISEELDINRQSIRWLGIYMLPLIFIYEICYNILVDFSFNFQTINKILLSTFYSSFICLIITILFYKKPES